MRGVHLRPGTILGNRYTVLETVSSGGMGAVYRVSDNRLAGAVCALKLMHAPDVLGAQADVIVSCFEKEMAVLTTLRHAGIPRVLDFFVTGESPCLVMDFVEGENLEQLRARGALSDSFIVDVARQVLEILRYLHEHVPAVIHRDIKPANLILVPGGHHIVLVDFGLARSVGSPGQTQAGTLGYAAVEQLQGSADTRSDLYSLGATLHYLVAGSLPPVFDLPALAGVVPGVLPALAALIDRAVKIDPASRFPDSASMLAELRGIQTAATGPGIAPQDSPDLPQEVPEPAGAGVEHILVIDDEPSIRWLIARVLRRELYQVTEADDGQKGLEMALRLKPDLIVSDVGMPGLDGVTLCRKLQNHRLTRHIPVLLLTGRTEVEDETEGLQAGAYDYITKPIIPERLVARVQAVLRRRALNP